MGLVAWKYRFDSTLTKPSVHPKYSWNGTVSSAFPLMAFIDVIALGASWQPDVCPWTGKSCFSNRALVKVIFEAPECSSSLMASLAKGFLRKMLGIFCGEFAEICKNTFYCVRKGCRNSAECLQNIRGDFRKIFCNDPFSNDPISELLILLEHYYRHQGFGQHIISAPLGVLKQAKLATARRRLPHVSLSGVCVLCEAMTGADPADFSWCL